MSTEMQGSVKVQLGNFRGFAWDSFEMVSSDGTPARVSHIGWLRREEVTDIASKLISAYRDENRDCCKAAFDRTYTFFSMVVETKDFAMLAVDHIGSFPLFYGKPEGSAYVVSDDPLDCTCSKKASHLGKLMFELGFITYGQETLWGGYSR